MPGELDKAEEFGADILRLCVKVGGVLTGEHGVGVEKRDLMPEMFNQIDLDQQMRVKCAFDPNHLLNPGKVFPAASALRRTRPHACPPGQAAVPGHSEVLMRLRQNPRRLAKAVQLPISLLAGEMSGRTEGGAKGSRLSAKPSCP